MNLVGRISPGPTRWPPAAERRLVPAKSNLKPQTHHRCQAGRPHSYKERKKKGDPWIILIWKAPSAIIKCNKRHGGWDYQGLGKLSQDCVWDVTLETQDHVGTALDGLYARNTVTCWVVNNVYVPSAPGLPRTGSVMIMEVDPAATTERDLTRIGGQTSLRSTCHPTKSENGMKTSVKSQTSRRMLLPDEAKEK